MNKTYAIPDLHGRYDLWEQIKDYIDETDTIYFLGDAIDRGPDGLKLMMELLCDDRVIYLKGNHEDFFVKYAEEAHQGHSSLIWLNNGGETTIKELSKYFSDSPIGESGLKLLVEDVNNLPEIVMYINKHNQKIILSHSGFDINLFEDYKKLNVGDEMPFDPLWDRNHFFCNWLEEDYRDTYMIHGHTPAPALFSRYGFKEDFFKNENGKESKIGAVEVIYYCNGHKIDIDLGSFATNKIALFNLDELKVEKYFTIEGGK